MYVRLKSDLVDSTRDLKKKNKKIVFSSNKFTFILYKWKKREKKKESIFEVLHLKIKVELIWTERIKT